VRAFVCAESFFKTLEEVGKLKGRHTKEDVRVEAFEYIKLYYTKRRRDTVLCYAIPIAVTHCNIA
jgi:hypothetical protein